MKIVCNQLDKQFTGVMVMNLKKVSFIWGVVFDPLSQIISIDFVPYGVSKQKETLFLFQFKVWETVHPETVHEHVINYLFSKQYNEVAVQNTNTISPIAPAIASGRIKEFLVYCSFTSFLSELIVESMSAVDVLMLAGMKTPYRRWAYSAECTETHQHNIDEVVWLQFFFLFLVWALLYFTLKHQIWLIHSKIFDENFSNIEFHNFLSF